MSSNEFLVGFSTLLIGLSLPDLIEDSVTINLLRGVSAGVVIGMVSFRIWRGWRK